MLSACDRGPGAEPRPFWARHVDFDMALPSEHGGMSGSKPATLQHPVGSVEAQAGTAVIRSSIQVCKLRRVQKSCSFYLKRGEKKSLQSIKTYYTIKP